MNSGVYISRISKFLPNHPILNEDMELYLGKINGTPSKAKQIILKSNGIKSRYYALAKDGTSTHSNARLTANAVLGLFDTSVRPDDIQLLACGTSTPDQLLPSHTSMVHGLINGGEMELYALSGSCCSGIQALKTAYLSVLSGNTSNAVCTGSERISKRLQARFYEEESENYLKLNQNPYIAFEKDFLRWMLSDGAGAVLLESHPRGKKSLKIEWIEMTSYAHEIESCMYAGCEKESSGDLSGWYEYTPNQWLDRSLLAVKQDVKLLRKYIVPMGVGFLKKLIKKRELNIANITYFLPHLSSEFFRKILHDGFKKADINLPQSKWFTNLSRIGNIGSASTLLMLEELFNSKRLKKGEQILLSTPESARFSYAFTLLTVI
jgi:3-oxoacyl-[acyl-carrier-protein] synthase-3